jgi:two-component system NtrC family response regulator
MSERERILFVDDDAAGRELSLYNLQEAGYRVELAEDGQQALELFAPERHDLVVTDLRMPRVSGMELLLQVKELAPDVPVVVITAHGNVEVAVQAMQAGAYDFIEKPFGRDVLLLVVERALERRRLTLENQALRARASGIEREVIARSEVMVQLLDTTDRVARSDASVLITGESGTGKELIARRIHARSPRASGPFVTVNCAAMPAELLESELFGHEKGAYTGASRARPGRFRRADGGTVFLDEVGEIPSGLQGKLLRVLQEGTVDVVGADQPVQVDLRVVAATNQSLPEQIAAGSFREDLYYRLNVVELLVPPLRERMDDLEPLVQRFVCRAAPGRDLAVPEEVMEVLRRYHWPGNVRELENACERMVILCQGDALRTEDLPPSLATTGTGNSTDTVADVDAWPPLPAEGLSLVDLERRVIERALALKGGNVTQAAAYLRVPRHVLAYRIEKYGIRRER